MSSETDPRALADTPARVAGGTLAGGEPDDIPLPAADVADDPVAVPGARLTWAEYRRQALGAVIAVAASVILIALLWLVAREAPSAGTDPRLITPVTASNPASTTNAVIIVPQPTTVP